MAEEKKSSKKTIIILLIVIILLLLGGGTAVLFNLNSGDGDDGKESQTGGIRYETQVGMIKPNEDLAEKLRGDIGERIPLHFSTTATSSDGENFKCVLGNPDGAPYDIYFDIYADENFTEQIYLSGLVAPGSQLEGFKSSKIFPEGTHDVVLVITQVEDDHKTLHLQTSVYLTLSVK